jgi:hypothetical protein
MSSNNLKLLVFRTLYWLCWAVLIVWGVLWLIGLFWPDLVDASNKDTIPWVVPAAFGTRLFERLSRLPSGVTP